jgi:predicted transcriptional regulator
MYEMAATTITIELPQDRRERLEVLARRCGLSIEDLVRASLEELLARPDERFDSVAEEVLRKNAELYRRLA